MSEQFRSNRRQQSTKLPLNCLLEQWIFRTAILREPFLSLRRRPWRPVFPWRQPLQRVHLVWPVSFFDFLNRLLLRSSSSNQITPFCSQCLSYNHRFSLPFEIWLYIWPHKFFVKFLQIWCLPSVSSQTLRKFLLHLSKIPHCPRCVDTPREFSIAFIAFIILRKVT